MADICVGAVGKPIPHMGSDAWSTHHTEVLHARLSVLHCSSKKKGWFKD